jgi:lauroyl/myristoyl acyltransferase
LIPPVKNDADGNIFLVAPHQGVRFSSLSLWFLTAYFLGMLSRYFPSKWLSLMGRTSGDSAWPLMKAASRKLEEIFPGLVERELFGIGVKAKP